MVPMAIPSFGGMLIEVVTMLVVPVLYCSIREFRRHTRLTENQVGTVILGTLGLGLVVFPVYCAFHDLFRSRRAD